MKLLIAFSLLTAAAAATLWLGSDALGRRLNAAELTLGSLALAGLGGRWLLGVRRRQRQKLEDMRDSALW